MCFAIVGNNFPRGAVLLAVLLAAEVESDGAASSRALEETELAWGREELDTGAGEAALCEADSGLH